MSSSQTFHFDLSSFNFQKGQPLVAKIAGKKIPLCKHNDTSLKQLRGVNSAAEILLQKRSDALTHFADLSEVPLQRGRIHKLTVRGHADEQDPTNHLPDLYYVGNVFHRDEHIEYLHALHLANGPFLPAALQLRSINQRHQQPAAVAGRHL
jgi:hypothetical protein